MLNDFLHTKVAREEVVARLEALLPGLTPFVVNRERERRTLRAAQVARLHRGGLQPTEQPLAVSVLGDIDGLLAHAECCGAIQERLKLTEDFTGTEDAELASLVLAGLPPSHEHVFVVSDNLSCYRVLATQLHAFLLRESSVTGACSFDGDEIFVASATPRIVVVHHSGWIFFLRPGLPTPSPPR